MKGRSHGGSHSLKACPCVPGKVFFSNWWRPAGGFLEYRMCLGQSSQVIFHSRWPTWAFLRQNTERACDLHVLHPQAYRSSPASRVCWGTMSYNTGRVLHEVPGEGHCSDGFGQVFQIPRLSISSVVKWGRSKIYTPPPLSTETLQLSALCAQWAFHRCRVSPRQESFNLSPEQLSGCAFQAPAMPLLSCD